MYPGFHAATQPDKPALVMGGGERISYRELDERSARFAQLLWSRGLRPGDKIALLAENHPRYFEVYWAAMRSGLYLTAVNRHLSAAEVAYLINDSGATALIATKHLAQTAASALDLVDNCPLRFMMDGVDNGFESYENAVAAQPAVPLCTRQAQPVSQKASSDP